MIERSVAELVMNSNLGGKLLVSPCQWQEILLCYSKKMPAAITCEVCEEKAVIRLAVCGAVLRVIAVPSLTGEEVEFTERKS
jgi:hypothetical protein